MSEHSISLTWKLDSVSFDYDVYSRDHAIIFGGDNRLCASAAPEFHGSMMCVNPEQAFVASLASCHMLTFLAIASKRRLVVTDYRDTAKGILGKNTAKKMAITTVTLEPVVIFKDGFAPDNDLYNRMHHQAHRGCFIANSIASCISVDINGLAFLQDFSHPPLDKFGGFADGLSGKYIPDVG